MGYASFIVFCVVMGVLTLMVVILLSIFFGKSFHWMFLSPFTRGALRRKAQRLGNVAGRPKNDIVKVLGKPNVISYTPNGEVCRWRSDKYFLELLFVGNVCQGVTAEIMT